MARRDLDAIRWSVRRHAAAEMHVGDSILEAKESGETIDDICKASGFGRTKVYKLIREAKERREQ